MKNIKLSVSTTACFVIFCVVLITATSSAQTPAPSHYENQQRAIRLLQFDQEIRLLSDVEIRYHLRFTILEFIYSNEVRSEYAAAEPILISLFEEMAAKEKDLVYRNPYWRNQLALLLRKHAPDTAKKIEAKYVPKVDTSGEDYQSLREGANVVEIVDRAIGKLTDKDRGQFLNIYENVRGKHPDLSNRMLDAALMHGEKHPGPTSAFLLNMLVDQVLNPPGPTVSPDRMLRYYRILVAGAHIELVDPKPDGYVATMWPLRRALPHIKTSDAKLYAEAQGVIAQYRKSLTKDNLAKEEADDRIEASDDKLEKAAAEAEAALSQAVKDYLWVRATQIAVQKGQFRRAVELIMKASPDLGYSTRPKSRDEDMWNRIARQATYKKDYDAAAYAVSQIKDGGIRASAMLQFGSEMGRSTEPRERSVTVLSNALDLMEMSEPPPDSICWVGNAIRDLSRRGKFVTPEKFNELVARAVGIVNRIAIPGTDAKPGTVERDAYTKSLVRVAPCTGYLFRNLEWPTLIPNPELANQLKVKEWRLAAQIEVEKGRRYPLPQ